MQSVRQPILNLMYRVLSHKGDTPYSVGDDGDLEEVKLCAQLINSGYLDGGVAKNGREVPIQAGVVDVTLEGRRYMDVLEREIRESTVTGKVMSWSKKAFWTGIGVVGGSILTLVTQYISKRLGIE